MNRNLREWRADRCRSLLAAEDIADGEPILALPLAKTRTSNRALIQLRLSEKTMSGQGL